MGARANGGVLLITSTPALSISQDGLVSQDSLKRATLAFVVHLAHCSGVH